MTIGPTIKPSYLNRWTYDSDCITGTSSFSQTIHINGNTKNIADAIDSKIRDIYSEKEDNMGIDLNKLRKDLRDFGVELSTIKQNPGEAGLEIEGYLMPDVYKVYRAKHMCSVPVAPKKPIPKKVIFSGPATTILWKDGTKTTVKCQNGDEWAQDVGIAMCYLKKMLGNKGNFNNIFREAEKVSEVQCKKEDTAKALKKALGGKK